MTDLLDQRVYRPAPKAARVPVLAALGDSTTAGYGDRVDGRWRGWAPIFAEAFGARLHNVAVSGGRAADLERDQLPKALAVRPDLGHRYLAYSFYDLLHARGLARGTRPSPQPNAEPPSMAAKLFWLSTAGVAWMIRRSTDLLPGLARTAWAEWRHGAPEPELSALDLGGDDVAGRVA
jgi:hypothetical protein